MYSGKRSSRSSYILVEVVGEVVLVVFVAVVEVVGGVVVVVEVVFTVELE